MSTSGAMEDKVVSARPRRRRYPSSRDPSTAAHEADGWKEAMDKDMANLKSHDVCDLAPRAGGLRTLKVDWALHPMDLRCSSSGRRGILENTLVGGATSCCKCKARCIDAMPTRLYRCIAANTRLTVSTQISKTRPWQEPRYIRE